MEELEKSESNSRMQQTSIAQPSIFAIQVALAALWESWGVKPTAIVGHSVG
jgi:acyl transferase domain-containing protein